MGSTDNSASQTTTQVLTPEQQRLASISAGNYEKFAASDPTLPGAAGVAGFDPLQTAGQDAVAASAGKAAGIVGGAGDANQRFTGGEFLDPDNASTQGAIRAAVRPLTDTFRDVTLPGIGADASTSGSGGISANFGGSRHGIAEGLAARDLGNKIGDVSSTIADRARSQGLEDILKAIGQAPTTAGAQTIPGGITSTVGDIRQGQAQRTLDASTAAEQFKQFLPLLMAQWTGQGAAGLPGGSTTTTGSSTQEANPVSQAIGVGATAAKFLPLMMGSDRRTKENIVYLRTLPNGHRWYSYNYIGETQRNEGVMADEVLKICPEAVYTNSDGMMVVDYSQILPLEKREFAHG